MSDQTLTLEPTPSPEAKPSTSSSSLLTGGMLAAAAVAGATLLTSTPAARAAVSPPLTYNADIPGSGDIKPLNYALALEALEADLYVQAYFRLTTGTTNAAGVVIPGLGLSRKEIDVAYLRAFANVELQHRKFINKALGSASLLASGPFSTAKFDFGLQNMTRKQVVNLIYTVEATGVRAYLGAIVKFSTKTFLQTAGAIQGTEARHTATMAIVQNILFGTSINTAPLANENNGIDQPLDPDTVLAAVSPYIILA